VAATGQQIQKSIREGLNTIRLHDREVNNRRRRQQQLEEEGNQHSDASESEFIEAPGAAESEDDQEDDWNVPYSLSAY